MYSPDHADIDPRNPANHDDIKADRFLIDGNQFTEEQLALLSSTETIDHVFTDEGLARDAAFALARTFGESVHIDTGTGEKGDYDWFDCIIVKHTVKVA